LELEKLKKGEFETVILLTGTPITPILTDFGLVIAELVDGLGSVVTFMVGNPLLIISVGLTVSGMIFAMVKGFIRH
jgi:hypothetical protein